MTTTLLHAVARKAEAITSDADLLARYTGERDHPAFEELVRRHGPLVWAVCRHLLPHHADAEDAFQAVFLALVRAAPNIRDGRAIPAWLHGVAVRIATRARREFTRRRARERAGALPEADRPVSDVAWEALVAAVHEEIQQLPEAERTAFVLCELQGVSQPDAAARLGWPLGSVSGRLCKARQRLLDRLTARGVAPAAVVGIGLTAGAASAVPANLFEVVKTFPTSSVAASSAATALARGLLEGVTMRMKLTAAAAVMVAALGLTGGAALLSKADAQPPAPGAGAPPAPGGLGGGGPGGLPPGGFDPRAAPPGAPGLPPGGGGPGGAGGFAPGAPPGAPGAGAGAPPGMGGAPGGGVAWATSHATWEHKFVDVKNDRKAFEQTITQHGKEGWEFCGSERFGQGDLVLVFKKKKGGDFPFGPVPGGPGGGFNPIGGGGAIGGGWRDWAAGIAAGAGADSDVLTLKLKNASATDVAAALNKILPKGATVVAEPNANVIVVVAGPAAIKDARKLIEDLDAKGAKVKPPVGPGPMGPGPGVGPGPVDPKFGPGPGAGIGPMPGGPPMDIGAPPAGQNLTVFNLKNAKAEDMAVVLKKLFRNADIESYSGGNAVIVRADDKTLDEIKALLSRLDTETPKPR
jgi:RNA polymerase sigma factor (sigma-70 family)